MNSEAPIRSPDAISALLSGRVAIVTGGGRGLGRAMARGLAQAGCTVIVTAAQQIEEIDAVAAEEGNDRIFAFRADVTRVEDCNRAVETALTRFGRIDVLVNNAGRGMKYVSETFIIEPTRFWEVEPTVWRMVIDTNVNGPFLMARAVVPTMLNQVGDGSSTSR
jgi:NAD(P)-dependent dehydrogenase (short-subunit alcohol dehydrogenase family)